MMDNYSVHVLQGSCTLLNFVIYVIIIYFVHTSLCVTIITNILCIYVGGTSGREYLFHNIMFLQA